MSSLSVCIHSQGQPPHSGWVDKGVDDTDIAFRNTQHAYDEDLKPLASHQIKQLKSQGNLSDDWDKIYVTTHTDVRLIHHCKFYGLNRIGQASAGFFKPQVLRIAHWAIPFHLYPCRYWALQCYSLCPPAVALHYASLCAPLGGESNRHHTPFAKFGVEPLRENEPKEGQVWLEIRNENTSRKILPFFRPTGCRCLSVLRV